MIKKLTVTLLLVSLILCSCKQKKKEYEIDLPNGRGIEQAEKLGMKLAIQSFTFHKFTLMETLDKVAELGLKYIEIYPGHIIGGKWGDKLFNSDLSDEEIAEIKDYAKQKEIEIVGHGVCYSDNIDGWNKLFAFAKKLGVSYITCDPEFEHLDLLDKLAQEYNIKAGIHNHPEPSRYKDPNVLLENIKDRSKLMGACADVGHWRRSGFDQVESLELLNGRIISLHMKDLAPSEMDDNELVDCLWGRGILDIDAMILELKNQKFEGYIAIEYETNWENSMKDLEECIFYYDLVTYRLLK